MPDISVITMVGATPTSGIVCSAYDASRFGSLPVAYDTAMPSGAADATATSGPAFGGTGQAVLTVSTSDAYWVGMTYGGHISWVESPALAGGATYAIPAVVLGTAAAAGSAGTGIRSDSTIVAFDATVPVTQGYSDAPAVGSAAVAARRDHVHGMPAAGGATYAIPAVVLGTAAAAGSAGTGIRSDGTIVAFDATAPTASAEADAAAVGTAVVAARRDHVHGREAFGGAPPAIAAAAAAGTATTPSHSDHTHSGRTRTDFYATALIDAGPAAVANNVLPPGYRVGRASTLNEFHVVVGTAPTGAALIVKLRINGTILTAANATVAVSTTTADVTGLTQALAVGDLLTWDITQIGSTIAGSDVAIAMLGT